MASGKLSQCSVTIGINGTDEFNVVDICLSRTIFIFLKKQVQVVLGNVQIHC